MSRYSIERLENAKAGYEKVLDNLKDCGIDVSRQEGEELLSFLDNRVRTTIIYLNTFVKARELKDLNRKKELSKQEKEEYVRISNQVIKILEQYIDLYASMNADRGCSGNLVSLWHGPLKAMKFMREKKGGVPFDDEVPENTAVDAPPLPVINPNK